MLSDVFWVPILAKKNPGGSAPLAPAGALPLDPGWGLRPQTPAAARRVKAALRAAVAKNFRRNVGGFSKANTWGKIGFER